MRLCVGPGALMATQWQMSSDRLAQDGRIRGSRRIPALLAACGHRYGEEVLSIREAERVSDRHRFEKVYADHYDSVLRYCLRRSDREDALDATAETFAVAWRRRSDMPAGRDHIDDHGAGVRGGHKENDHHKYGNEACDPGQRKLLQEHEKG